MNDFYEGLGNDKKLSIIAGPCVFEDSNLAVDIASSLSETCKKYDVNFCFKMSFDKANRTSINGYRGKGIEMAMNVFDHIHTELDVPTITDVHDVWQAEIINTSILQIPAFLCRQTDLLEAAVLTGKPVNVKKGQFLSPWEMKNVVDKLKSFGYNRVIVTERGTTFGYNNLVVDMRGLDVMKEYGPVVMDCTHAVQHPGGGGDKSSGNSYYAPILAKAAVAIGIAGVFMEVHPDPESSPSDGANMIRLDNFETVLKQLLDIDGVVKNVGN